MTLTFSEKEKNRQLQMWWSLTLPKMWDPLKKLHHSQVKWML